MFASALAVRGLTAPDRLFVSPPAPALIYRGSDRRSHLPDGRQTCGADGYYYVGERRGFPATPGKSEIWRVAPDSVNAVCDPAAPSTGACRRYADGFTSIVDLEAGADGSLYVVELVKQSWLQWELGLANRRSAECSASRPAAARPSSHRSLTLIITVWLYIHNIMNAADAHLDATFAALADPTRRAILARLASGAATVSELAEPFDLSQPAISKHLKVLEQAGLISGQRDAQRRPRRLEAGRLAEATAWLEQYREFWEGSFARLDVVLDELTPSKPRRVRRRKGRS